MPPKQYGSPPIINPDIIYQKALQGISGQRVREIHPCQNGETVDFQWTYAAPLKPPTQNR
jgi:hypothetical protein